MDLSNACLSRSRRPEPPAWLSAIPVAALLCSIATVIITLGPDAVQTYSYMLLLGSAALALIISVACGLLRRRRLAAGLAKSMRQILPAVPILLCIGMLSATWMLGGVVPLLIDYGLQMLNPGAFLVTACAVCAVVSVVTGTSWTTIATIGVAFMGIGTAMGHSPAWIAGAVISGAYFGDKVSPLSDTTVLAAASTGVKLFTHIRFLMITTVPAMTLALTVYAIAGFTASTVSAGHAGEISSALRAHFHLTPWLLAVPALTGALIAARVRTDLTLGLSALAGLAAMFVWQPEVAASLGGGVKASLTALLTSTEIATGNEALDSLVATGGAEGMLPTVWLVLSAMTFGGVMLGTGMLQSLTSCITRNLVRARSTVSATVGSGLFLNCCTGDQYLSLIVGANMFNAVYRRNSLKPQTLSRSLEDSVSVTSVLIPWNSCGVTQSTVLGVATLTYLPYCIFNIASPLVTLAVAWMGWRVHTRRAPAVA